MPFFTFQRSPLEVIVNGIEKVFNTLAKFHFVRWASGGIWAKMDDKWLQAHSFHLAEPYHPEKPPVYFLQFRNTDGNTSTIHQTFVSIQSLEIYTTKHYNETYY